jgi:hypothetical protein
MKSVRSANRSRVLNGEGSVGVNNIIDMRDLVATTSSIMHAVCVSGVRLLRLNRKKGER